MIDLDLFLVTFTATQLISEVLQSFLLNYANNPLLKPLIYLFSTSTISIQQYE